jgi:DNA polymerase III subunit epsilon
MEGFPPGFAVLDVETTGLRPSSDRIVEIAVVRTDMEGRVISELATLVNPERSAGATHIHGLGGADLEGAPTFPEVLGPLVRYLAGAVIVGHNVRFDASFLQAEFSRAGRQVPGFPLACTREMALRILPRLGDFKLSSCCRSFGIENGHEHHALDDARAAAALFMHFSAHEAFAERIAADLERAKGLVWPAIDAPSRLVPRGEGRAKKAAEAARLAEVAKALGEGTSGGAAEGYFAVLDEILDDRRVTEEEAMVARAFAVGAGLLQGDAELAHRAYLTGVARLHLARDVAGGVGAGDIEHVARLLGFSEDDVTRAIAEARSGAPAPVPGASRPIRAGMSVCFSGETIPPKDELEWRARDAGLRVASGVSKKLDMLVVDDPYSMSAKTQKARAIGTRVLVVPVFLSLVTSNPG